MANDCFLKSLKGTLNNDTLLKYGELRMTVYKDTADPQVRFGRVAGDNVTGVDMDTNETAFVLNNTTSKVVTFNKTINLSIISKYQLNYIKNTNACAIALNLDDLKGCVNLVDISLGNAVPASSEVKITGSLASLGNLSLLSELNLNSPDITENISGYPVFSSITVLGLTTGQNIALSTLKTKFPNVTTLTLGSYVNISGDAADIPNIANIGALTLGANCRVSGNINAFANSHSLAILRCNSSVITITGQLSSIKHLATQYALKALVLPTGVTYTAADKAEMVAAGCTVSGGTEVPSYL